MTVTGVASVAVAAGPGAVAADEPRPTPKVVLPSIHDPRLHVAAVVITLQVLGQTVLGFDLSIAQILVTVATCASIEVALTYWQRRVIMWPASALLTANGTAFILRIPGTVHGDWWSLRGWHTYVAIGALGVLSKWVIRFRGDHLFNPSNVALVIGFLALGPKLADPQDLWWGPMSPALAVTLLVILGGGLVITHRLRMLGLALAFWGSFAVAVGALAAAGHCMRSRWSLDPVCGRSFWWVVVLSPEIFVFALFMITDPKTTPQGRVARMAYGAGVGLLAALALAPQRTEFATKVAILSSLVVVCAGRPIITRLLPAAGADDDRLRLWLRPKRLLPGSLAVVAVLGLVMAAGAPARHPSDAATPTVRATARPVVKLGPGAVPVVEVAPGVRRLEASLDRAQAQRLGRELAADLVIEARAFKARSVDLAGTAVTGARLEAFRARAGGQPAPAGEAPFGAIYRLLRLTVVVVTDPHNFQAVPRLGLRADVLRTNTNVLRTDSDDLRRSVTFVIADDAGPARLVDIIDGG